MSVVISLHEIKKGFGYPFLPDYRRAEDGVSMELQRGEVMALLGPNGAGKTTTHRILNGLLKPDGGTAAVLGCPVNKLGRAQRQRMAFVAESQELPGELTVSQAVAWVQPMYPQWDRAFERRLRDLFQLPAGGTIGSFSRGMKMKTACLLSLASHPEVIFMDEPFAGMDAVVRDEIVEALLGLARDEGWTMLLSSHDIDDVERLADRVAVINAGRLILDDTLDVLQERCRRLTFQLPGDALENTPPLPDTWRHYRRGPRFATVVETAWQDMDAALEKIHAHRAGAGGLEVASLSLREIYTALVRTDGAVA